MCKILTFYAVLSVSEVEATLHVCFEQGQNMTSHNIKTRRPKMKDTGHLTTVQCSAVKLDAK